MNNCSCGKLLPNKKKICSACQSRIWRAKNTYRAAYIILKFNAKRRGHEFTLTFEQFKKFAIKTKYIKGKGIFRDNLHIDRKDETKGYTIDNIQILTNSQNIRKYLEYKFDDYERKMKARIILNKHEVIECEAF
jgi:hypothetical protein